jgi:hypothetical protein
MVEEKVRRRAGFQSGRWVRMGDRQQWMFPPPPTPGIDPEYDALTRIHQESEDADDERRIELAMAILLLSGNYDLTPDEYVAIFSFGTDPSAISTAQAAISEVVRRDVQRLNVHSTLSRHGSRSRLRHWVSSSRHNREVGSALRNRTNR